MKDYCLYKPITPGYCPLATLDMLVDDLMKTDFRYNLKMFTKLRRNYFTTYDMIAKSDFQGQEEMKKEEVKINELRQLSSYIKKALSLGMTSLLIKHKCAPFYERRIASSEFGSYSSDVGFGEINEMLVSPKRFQACASARFIDSEIEIKISSESFNPDDIRKVEKAKRILEAKGYFTKQSDAQRLMTLLSIGVNRN